MLTSNAINSAEIRYIYRVVQFRVEFIGKDENYFGIVLSKNVNNEKTGLGK